MVTKASAQKPEQAPKTLLVRSPAFDDARGIPVQHTPKGANRSPALVLDELPEDSRSLAVLVEDIDVKGRPQGIFVHWTAWNLPGHLDEVPEGVDVTQMGGMDGVNDFGDVGYGGPAPPEGFMHRYKFRVFSLDTKLGLPRGAKASALRRAMEGHVLAWGEIEGRASG